MADARVISSGLTLGERPAPTLVKKDHIILVRQLLQVQDAAVVAARAAVQGDNDGIFRVAIGFPMIGVAVDGDRRQRWILIHSSWDGMVADW